MAKHESDTSSNKAKNPRDLSRPSKAAPIELTEQDLGRVTGGTGGGSYIKLDYKE